MRGGRGVPEIFFGLEYFCYLGAHAKFCNPICLLSGIQVREREEEERKKLQSKVATYIYASSQGQRTNSAQTNVETCLVLNVVGRQFG